MRRTFSKMRYAFASLFLQIRLHVAPELRTADLDLWADSSDDALISHTVLQSASALIAQVQQDRHASVVFSRRLDLTQDSLEFVDLKDESNDVRDTLSVACLNHVEAPAFPDAVSPTIVTARFVEWHRAHAARQ